MITPTLIAIIGANSFLIGATLRHLQGGLDAYFGLHRWQVVIGYGALSGPAVWAYWHVPLFGVPDLGLLRAVAMTALFMADMTMAQDFSKPWKVLWRFGMAPVIVALLTGWWPAMGVGVVLAVGTCVLKKWGGKLPVCAPWADGWEAYWEVMIGGVTGAAWAVAPLLGHISSV